MTRPKRSSSTARLLWADDSHIHRLSIRKLESAGASTALLRSYLPAAHTVTYGEGQKIYAAGQYTKNIYLVVAGMVEISQTREGCSGLLLEIIQRDELFGESAFLKDPCPSEEATTLEDTTLMSWPISEVEALVGRRPELAVALRRFFAQRNAEINRRIGSLSLDTVERRLARSLIRFSQRLGMAEGDGGVRIVPLTHEMLSRHAGGSVEIVVQCMDRFRKQGYVTYSPGGIVLHQDPLQRLLSKPAKRLEHEKTGRRLAAYAR